MYLLPGGQGALGGGRDWRKYLPLTYLQQSVPAIFVLSYLVGSYLVGFCATVGRTARS
ncbi:hypothetical protein ACIGXF_21210 [Streptomyces sp. NPDC053086]|uniref:hypothetical protein n=1 Tax=Streptomyces sp. NPDC053086 TaxID=3365698 RepID=UPI0037D3C0ED